MKIACPYCTQHYDIKLEYIGMEINCITCKKIFIIDQQYCIAPITPNIPIVPPTPIEQNPIPLVAQPVNLPPPKSVGTIEPIQTITPLESPRPVETTRAVLPPQPIVQPQPISQPQPVVKVVTDPNNSGQKLGSKDKSLHIVGNLLWLLFGGLYSGIVLFLAGVLYCITILGIPFGLQLFKVANLFLSPFGADIYNKSDKPVGCFATLGNVAWIFTFGIISCINSFLIGILFCCTIIGIPFGLQYFKLGKLILAPFGLEIRRTTSMRSTYIAAAAIFAIEIVLAIIAIIIVNIVN